MNTLILGKHKRLIPAKWQECRTDKAIAILKILKKNLPKEATLLAALFVVMDWEYDKWLWVKSIFKWVLPKSKFGEDSTPWWKDQFTRMTTAQKMEWLLCMEWIYTPLAFDRERGMLKMPYYPILIKSADGKRTRLGLDLPGSGLSRMTWGQYVCIDLHLKRWISEKNENALHDAIACMYMPTHAAWDEESSLKFARQVAAFPEEAKELILIWFRQCEDFMVKCHPHVYPADAQNSGENTGKGDPYGLIGLTHRVATSTSDVANVEKMTAWQVLDNLEIKLADKRKHPEAA